VDLCGSELERARQLAEDGALRIAHAARYMGEETRDAQELSLVLELVHRTAEGADAMIETVFLELVAEIGEKVVDGRLVDGASTSFDDHLHEGFSFRIVED